MKIPNPYLPYFIEYQVTNGLGYSDKSLKDIVKTLSSIDYEPVREINKMVEENSHLLRNKAVQEMFILSSEIVIGALETIEKRSEAMDHTLNAYYHYENLGTLLDQLK